MTISTETTLFKINIRRWRSIHSGCLVIEPSRLVIYRQQFLGKLKEARNFKMDYLRAVEEDTAHNDVKLTFEVLGGTTCETLSFFKKDDALIANGVLSGLLKEAEVEKRRREEELARLQQKEREEHQRQIHDSFVQDIWETTETIWSLVKANYLMVNAVITHDWNEAKRHYSIIWQQADKLKSAHQIELTVPLQELDEKMCTENGEEAIKKTGLVLENLANQILQTEMFWEIWRKNENMTFPITPNWNHIPYFLLFSARYFDTILSLKIEDWTGVSHGLSVLRSTSDVLRQCFKVDLDEFLDTANSANEKRDAKLLSEIAQSLESAVVASFKTRHFEYTNSQ